MHRPYIDVQVCHNESFTTSFDLYNDTAGQNLLPSVLGSQSVQDVHRGGGIGRWLSAFQPPTLLDDSSYHSFHGGIFTCANEVWFAIAVPQNPNTSMMRCVVRVRRGDRSPGRTRLGMGRRKYEALVSGYGMSTESS